MGNPAQRVAFPIVRQHDAAQVGVVQEVNAEQVENFTFVPVGPTPHESDRFDRRVCAVHPALEAYALFVFHRVEMIHHFEARLGG